MKSSILTLIIVVFISGCSLAAPIDEKSNNDPSEQMFEQIPVGIYVTTEDDYVSFDSSNTDQTYFLIDEEKQGEQSYTFSKVSGNFFDSHVEVAVGDSSTSHIFKGKVPLLSNKEGIIRIFSLIKDENGNYVEEASDNYWGDNVTITLNSTQETKINGETKTVNLDVTIEFIKYDPLSEVRIIRMDESYNVINSMILEDQSDLEIVEDEIIVIEETKINIEQKEYKTVSMYTYQQVKESNEIQHLLFKEADSLFADVQAITIKTGE